MGYFNRFARQANSNKTRQLGLERLEARDTPSANPVIAGSVYSDLNGNGRRDADEPGIAASSLQLVTPVGILVGEAISDDNGQFSFDSDRRLLNSSTVASFTVSLTNLSASSGSVATIPRFNPALGTLTAVDIEVNGQIEARASVENLERNAATIRVSHDGALTVTGQGGPIELVSTTQTFTAVLGGYDGTTDFTGSSGITFPRRTSSITQTANVTDPMDLANFIGTGSVVYQAVATGTATSQGPGNFQISVLTTGSADITVRYLYEPSTALTPGNYIVRQTTQPDGTLDGLDTRNGITPIPGSAFTDEIPLTLTASGISTLGFGEVKAAALQGIAFIDNNGDAVFDTDEIGAEGVTVTLTGTDDTGAKVTRAADVGADALFSFTDLRPGNYSVVSGLLPKFIAGPGQPGDAGGISAPVAVGSIRLGSGQNATRYLLPQSEGSALSGTVYLDRNSNGIRDEGEPGLPNQPVTLSGNGPFGITTKTARTDTSGGFTFVDLLPGTYQVSSPVTGGFTATGTEAGDLGGTSGTDSISDIVIGSGSLGDNYNLGRSVVLNLAGRAFLDRNADGRYQPSDTLLPGVRVTLTGMSSAGQAITRQAVTNAAGRYAFIALPDGIYQVAAQAVSGTVITRGVVGSVGGSAGMASISQINLGLSGSGVGYDFPMIPPSRITGVVFNDLNRNGVRNPGELGIANIIITLTGNDDLGRSVRRQTVTAADGSYAFDNLRSGSYFVSRTVPTGYQAGAAKVGSLGGMVRNGGIGLSLGVASTALRYDFAVIQVVPPTSTVLSKRRYIA